MSRVTLNILSGPEYSRDDDGWEHNAYKVELMYEGRRMRTPWRQGLGITSEPTVADVLESLFLDAAGYDCARDFEDWASEYGYDIDSRKAESLYRQVGTASEKLAKLFAVPAGEHGPWVEEDAEDLARRLADVSAEVEL